MNCRRYIECPYCVERVLPRKGKVLTCEGEWGRTCLIWKEALNAEGNFGGGVALSGMLERRAGKGEVC